MVVTFAKNQNPFFISPRKEGPPPAQSAAGAALSGMRAVPIRPARPPSAFTRPSGGGGVLPVASGVVTQVFGPTNEPLDSGGVNKGIDIAAPVGTAVSAVTGGTVIQAGWGNDGWGISVKIRDAEGNVHNYGHLSGVNVAVGQTIAPGTVLGAVGNTGASTGPHLSYDVMAPSGQFVDPSRWLGFNAAGDNRSGHPIIGRNIAELAPAKQAAGPRTYPPEVERWRSLVARYFRPEDVDKALWVIMHESGGNPQALGDGGASGGLFQLNDYGVGAGMTNAQKFDPETNIARAAQAVYGGQGWRPWGEGATYNGRPFGALGNNPYPGDGGRALVSSDWEQRYAATYAEWAPLYDKYTIAVETGAIYVPGRGWVVGAAINPATEQPDPATGQVVMSEEEFNRFVTLDRQVKAMEDEWEFAYENEGSLDDAIRRATFEYETDPRVIDAQNAAKRWAREMEIRSEAASLANERLRTSREQQRTAIEQTNAARAAPAMGQLAMAPRKTLPSADELFEEAIAKVREGLPEVPDMPYWDNRTLPPASGLPSLPSVQVEAGSSVIPSDLGPGGQTEDRITLNPRWGMEQQYADWRERAARTARNLIPEWLLPSSGAAAMPKVPKPAARGSAGGGGGGGGALVGSILGRK